MTKFNTARTRTAPGPAPIQVSGPAVVNHQGSIGYTRDPKSDLFLLATTSLDITADAFHEGGTARVDRYVALIRQVAVQDPQWTYQFLVWLRTHGNIRTAAVVGAVEAARALVQAGIPGGRPLIADVLTRPDEPGEALAYHLARHGRKIPKAIKRGVADAATRLYSERSLLKYDTASHAVRFGDVLDLTHPTPDPGKPWQADLFTYALNRRHGRDDMVPAALTTVMLNRELRAEWGTRTDLDRLVTAADFHALIGDSGMTWEDALSALGSKVDKRLLWEALIPTMGYMALLRNLRNFDQAGVSDTVAAKVAARLSDPAEVAMSRQLPLRFLSAYRAAPSLRWAHALEQALDHSTANIPALPGRTLVLVDTSGSMHSPLSDRSDLLRWDAAVNFGLALARRCEAVDVVSYSNDYYGNGRSSLVFPTNRGESLLKSIDRWNTGGFFIGAGTDTAGALRKHYAGHDRAVLLTDEQDGGYTGGLVTDQMPKDRPLYTFNLAGYATSHTAVNPYRVTLGGLTDHMFALIPRIEQGRTSGWPWEGAPAPGMPGWQVPTGARTAKPNPDVAAIRTNLDRLNPTDAAALAIVTGVDQAGTDEHGGLR